MLVSILRCLLSLNKSDKPPNNSQRSIWEIKRNDSIGKYMFCSNEHSNEHAYLKKTLAMKTEMTFA